jgi:hypothetical protein
METSRIKPEEQEEPVFASPIPIAICAKASAIRRSDRRTQVAHRRPGDGERIMNPATQRIARPVPPVAGRTLSDQVLGRPHGGERIGIRLSSSRDGLGKCPSSETRRLCREGAAVEYWSVLGSKAPARTVDSAHRPRFLRLRPSCGGRRPLYGAISSPRNRPRREPSGRSGGSFLCSNPRSWNRQ